AARLFLVSLFLSVPAWAVPQLFVYSADKGAFASEINVPSRTQVNLDAAFLNVGDDGYGENLPDPEGEYQWSIDCAECTSDMLQQAGPGRGFATPASFQSIKVSVDFVTPSGDKSHAELMIKNGDNSDSSNGGRASRIKVSAGGGGDDSGGSDD